MHKKPSPRVLWSWWILLVAVALPITVVGGWGLRLLLPPKFFLILALLWGLFVLFAGAVYLPLRWQRMSFSLGQDVLSVTGGVWWRTTRRMRRDAVRQVTRIEGPIERLCHTAFLLVRSTGGWILIEGIHRDTAEDWCRRLCDV